MDSIENGATIRIGFKHHDKTIHNMQYTCKELTYSLKINKKTILMGNGGGIDSYMQFYEDAAKKIAAMMNEKDIKEYVIYNGERVRSSDLGWESCEDVPQDGKEIFKKTLIDCLNGIQ